MLIVQLMGGLGNQMFQYATIKAVSSVKGFDFSFDFNDAYKLEKRSIALNEFNLTLRIAPKRNGSAGLFKRYIDKLISRRSQVFLEKEFFVYDPAISDISDGTYVSGFWQSYKYFSNIRRELLIDYSLKHYSPAYIALAEEIEKLNNPVAIHVRRGDYLNSKSGFHALDRNYYESAIRQMGKFGEFEMVMFTNDWNWVEENSDIFRSSLNIKNINGLSDAEEMLLFSKCKHQIIANSSYSWWGAWLNNFPDKMVIAPKNWAPSFHDISSFDLIPPEWILI